MKYLITESQIDKIVYKYFNDLDLYMIEDKGDYYFYTSKLSWSHGEYPIIAYHKNHDDCFISSDILTEVAEFFSLSLTRSLMIIAKWVEGKIGIEIKYPYSDYGAG